MSNTANTPNPVLELFGVEIPIIQAGMVWCSGYRLASAVSEAGALGVLGAGSMTPELLAEHIDKTRVATSKPFGVNIPMISDRAEEHVKTVIDKGVKIVFTSAGNPALFIPRLKDAGLKVVHVVSSVKFALKARAAGADAVVAEGFEAGGHNGREEITTFCLVPAVKEAVDIPVIAAGGIISGRGMLGAMALGADAVQVGTRFALTHEASCHPEFKNHAVKSGEGDTRLLMKQLIPVRLLKNQFMEEVVKAEAGGAGPEVLRQLLGKGRAKKGIFEGDMQNGELEIGQAAAYIDKIESAGEVVRSMYTDFLKFKSML